MSAAFLRSLVRTDDHLKDLKLTITPIVTPGSRYTPRAQVKGAALVPDLLASSKRGMG